MFNVDSIKLHEIVVSLKPIALHNSILTKCALIFAYYPMKKSKLDIYLTLDKNQRVGMLFRHILGVASKLGVYQTILREITNIRQQHKKYKKYLQKVGFETEQNECWKDAYERNGTELLKKYSTLLDIMFEELRRRNDPKYLRKKKLNEIEENIQN